MQESRKDLDITLAAQIEDAPDSVMNCVYKRYEADQGVEMSEHNTHLYLALYRFATLPPREGNIKDAIWAQRFKVDEVQEPEEAVPQESARDENEEQPEDADELTAVECDIIESSGYSF